MYSIEELEKMAKEACEKNDYEMYKKACCLLHTYIKFCKESEEYRACYVLFDALCNEKSEGFLNIAREDVTNNEPSASDIMVYSLLLSVRVPHEDIASILLQICDEIQDEVLNIIMEGKSEKREQRENL